MEFREIKYTDLKIVLHLLSQLTETPVISEKSFKDFLDSKSKNNFIYIMVIDSKPVGMGTLFIEKKIIHNLGSVGHIEDVVIGSEHRGKQFGKKLITFLIETAKNKECYKVILDCDEKNKNFYEKCSLYQKGMCMAKYFNQS